MKSTMNTLRLISLLFQLQYPEVITNNATPRYVMFKRRAGVFYRV